MTSIPRASRPHMPDYGIQGPGEGSGLLPWTWAEERLRASRNFWITSLWPDGRPHSLPVWGVWDAGALWFSSGPRSRRARNLAADPRCVITTEDANNPVMLDGRAAPVIERERIARIAELMEAKYATGFTVGFLLANATFGVTPSWAFGLAHDDFKGSPTGWDFNPAE